jgi:Protein of unknown function (DUF2561)
MTGLSGLRGVGPLADRLSRSPQTVDRGLVTACAVIWLLVLGMGVAATVALVDLGRSHPVGIAETSWPLYVVIAVSVLVIAVSIPLLLRARQSALRESSVVGSPALVLSVPAAAGGDPPGYPGPMPARHSSAALPAEVLDRMWLRCGLGVLAVMGLAMFAVALATYLLAVESNGAATAMLGVAAVITVAMAAVPEMYLRQLRAALADA